MNLLEKRRKVTFDCYICDKSQIPKTMRPLNGPERQELRDASEKYRHSLNKQFERGVTEQDYLCHNCHKLVLQLMPSNEDQLEIPMNVVHNAGFRRCLICSSDEEVTVLSFTARLQIFVDTEKFVMKNCRACKIHLRESGELLPAFYESLSSIDRNISLDGKEISEWFSALRTRVANAAKNYWNDETQFSEEDFETLTSITKSQFNEMFMKLIPSEKNDLLIHKKDLFMLLVKMRQGLSDQFLKAIFHMSSRPNVSRRIKAVVQSVMESFVPKYLGLEAINRNTFISNHVSEFANKMYVQDFDQNKEKKAIVIIDGTYLFIPKLSNYRVLRQSFSVHKKRHLLKPVLVVAPDGYILDVHGPYFADGKNNDAALLRHHMEKDGCTLRTWLEPSDVVLVDRGYRDFIPYLESLGIESKMPAYLDKSHRQHTTEEANKSRLVTKSRWVVESRNGHVKSIFKLFRGTIEAVQIPSIGDYFKIACAVINAYHPPIKMLEATEEMATKMLVASSAPNKLQLKIETENLDRADRKNPWFELNANVEECIPEFPHLDMDYLRDLTFGVYQIKQAKSYVHDKLQRDSEYKIKIRRETEGILRAKIYSRHTQSAKYDTWVWFKEEPDDESPELIKGWYCKCKSGARTVGCCAHIASILWYMGYSRHLPNVPHPSDNLLYKIEDAADRELPSIL